MTKLVVQSISKKYKKKEVLKNCSFTANVGQCVALCGGNGTGKTTLLHILAKITAPTSGFVALNEIPITNKEYINKIGFMPDDYYAQDEMTVLEFLSYYASFRKVSKTRIEEVLHLIGLKKNERELLKNLSKGMKQRLLLGQAILGEPSLLLLDEPTNGLDPYWTKQFVQIIEDLKRKDTIIVLSTHMLDIAHQIADIIIDVENG